MSQVKVQGNASGTGIFTIASPNSNSNYTFTLPTETGTVLTNAGPYTASSSATAGAVTIDASNNVGIGVTPSAWSGAWKAIQVGSVAAFTASGTTATYGCNWYDDGTAAKYVTNGFAARYTTNNAGQHQWFTAASGTAGNAISFTQAMTLDSSGNLLVGATSTSGIQTATAGGAVFNKESSGVSLWVTRGNGGGSTMNVGRTSGAGTGTYVEWFYNNTNTGTVTTNGTGTTYGTSSDYRLKENVAPMTGALAKVALLKPCTYTWKSDGTPGQGFIAHELQEVVPDAVVGEKDAVNEDGSIKPQAIDTSFLVATLTAAIQEQQALINDLTARIAALEAK